MSCQSVTPWKDAPAASTPGVSVVGGSTVICLSSCVVSSSVLVMKDLVEVCPLSREVMLQLLSVPLQDGFRFFHIPLPIVPSGRLAVSYPISGGLWAYRVPYESPGGLGSLS